MDTANGELEESKKKKAEPTDGAMPPIRTLGRKQRDVPLKTGFRTARLEALGLAAWGTLTDFGFSTFPLRWHDFGM
jgi:hypothetical protein